ncbi:MAG TPA: OFA family MFS transporter [Gemmatimonadales bacterium]|nr:OFA family MFS transporter [Gemmatimonadales bacterium]
MAGFLTRERIVAGPGFNRWLVPPAALAIHLSIGQAYAFSVFKLPLTKIIGITQPAPGDWTQPELAWIFTIAIVFLGLSAALFGRWLERAGPRKSGVAAALCWSAGFLVSAVGVRLHNIWLLYLGYGVLGGCGLGLGYITPVSTLIKWFPDRRGMATGMAIMGFGGGAMIGAPLADLLMKHYATPTSVGVSQTFVTMGLIYLVAMLAGAFLFRVPPPGFTVPPPVRRSRAITVEHAPLRPPLITVRHVHVDTAWKTPQFWLLWAVLFLNVSAGIGILEQASPMIQEMFKGRVTASAAAGFVGLLSLFNMAGRFSWSSLSDRIGRKRTYGVFFTLGPLLYITVPFAGRIGSVILFVAAAALIITMYGGGFATIPAYLSDLFGTQFVGAIHGRLLTAWSAAGVAGPVLVNYIREYQIHHGVPAAQAYNVTMLLMAGLLVVGFFCNLAVRPVAEGFYMTEDQLARERAPATAA